MTVRVDYTQLDQPPLRLSLVSTPTGWYSVIDQHGQLYFPPTQDIETCLRFMTAMREKKQALIDDASVEQATWTAAYESTHSVDANLAPVIPLPVRKGA